MDTHDQTAGIELARLFDAQRTAFARQPLPDASTRTGWLNALEVALTRNSAAICDAISADFGYRPSTETRMLELFPSLEGIRYARRHIRKWMRPERRHVSIWFQPGRAQVRYQPLGVAGIIVPWNYPLYLAVGPLVAALAAGNRAMIKMSEYSPAFGALFAKLVADTFPADLVHVVLGDVEVAKAFSQLPFDHLLFTGSTPVGRDVMANAARHLTPVTLELGGKSPAIIAPDFNVERAAQRIAFGKLVNAGQTCIAPDYVLAPLDAVDRLVNALQTKARAMLAASDVDYASIAHDRHFQRLQALLADARDKGARIVPLIENADLGGARRMAPVILLDGTDEMRVMREEIFGPILPVVGYRTLDDAIEYVNRRDRPLALYVFDERRDRVDALLDRTASGGVTVNDCLLHIAQDDMPFGGVGPAGMGRYHGSEGFKTFSQVRSVFRQPRLNAMPLLHPPYGGTIARRLLKIMLRD